MEYRLLTYIPDFQWVGITHNFPYDRWHVISETPNSDEYDYYGFEYENRALSKVFNHAAAMIKILEKEDDLSAFESVKRDYHNAIKCFMVDGYGYRPQMDAFTSWMLTNNWETVVDCITEAYEENKKRNQDDLKESEIIPDYSILFIECADAALLIDEDFDKAIKLYTVATFEWRSRYSGNKTKYSITIGEKQKLRKYIQLFLAIHDDRYTGKDFSFLNDVEKDIVEQYNSIYSEYNKHEEIVNDIETLVVFIENVEKKMKNQRNHLEYKRNETSEIEIFRMVTIIMPKLVQMAYLQEISMLSDEPEKKRKEIKEIALEKVLIILKHDLIPLFMCIDKKEDKLWDVLVAAGNAKRDIDNIKQKLRIKGEIPELAYYTTWNTFSYMLPKDKQDNGLGRFSVMHHSYMNDPLEGNVIKQFLYDAQDYNGRKQETHPYVFIKCFTQSIDYLPMWKMYGDEAKGCCIVIDWKKTIERNPGKNIALYKVCYLTKKGKNYVFQMNDNNRDKDFAGMKELLDKLKADISKLSDSKYGKIYANSLLGSIAYLFKDSSYSYEKEARVIYSFDKLNSQIEKTNQEPPKLFVYTDYDVVIKEIILGPKFENTYLWTPFIQSQIEKLNNVMSDKETPYRTELTLSDINFR